MMTFSPVLTHTYKSPLYQTLWYEIKALKGLHFHLQTLFLNFIQ